MISIKNQSGMDINRSKMQVQTAGDLGYDANLSLVSKFYRVIKLVSSSANLAQASLSQWDEYNGI
jgi:hypothetical protein